MSAALWVILALAPTSIRDASLDAWPGAHNFNSSSSGSSSRRDGNGTLAITSGHLHTEHAIPHVADSMVRTAAATHTSRTLLHRFGHYRPTNKHTTPPAPEHIPVNTAASDVEHNKSSSDPEPDPTHSTNCWSECANVKAPYNKCVYKQCQGCDGCGGNSQWLRFVGLAGVIVVAIIVGPIIIAAVCLCFKKCMHERRAQRRARRRAERRRASRARRGRRGARVYPIIDPAGESLSFASSTFPSGMAAPLRTAEGLEALSEHVGGELSDFSADGIYARLAAEGGADGKERIRLVKMENASTALALCAAKGFLPEAQYLVIARGADIDAEAPAIDVAAASDTDGLKNGEANASTTADGTEPSPGTDPPSPRAVVVTAAAATDAEGRPTANTATGEGREDTKSPLELACMGGHKPLVAFLLSEGARDSDGRALKAAREGNHSSTAALLAGPGADDNAGGDATVVETRPHARCFNEECPVCLVPVDERADERSSPETAAAAGETEPNGSVPATAAADTDGCASEEGDALADPDAGWSIILPCRHAVHASCLTGWAMAARRRSVGGEEAVACPVCKQEVPVSYIVLWHAARRDTEQVAAAPDVTAEV